MPISLIEIIMNKDSSSFEAAIMQGIEFEPKERVYKFGNDEYDQARWNIIEIAALLDCDESVFDELKKRGATAINESEDEYVTSSIEKITERLVYKGFGRIDEDIYDHKSFLKVVFSLFRIGAKPIYYQRNNQVGSTADITTANALIRAGCTREQLEDAMEKYNVKFNYATLEIAMQTGWLLKNSEHFKFIQNHQEISNRELNDLVCKSLHKSFLGFKNLFTIF